MPETTTYLDKTRRKQVPKDEAVFFWHRVTDDAGKLVSEHLGVMDVNEDEDKDALDKAGHTEVWVAFWLPKQAADALAVQGGEPVEDLHLTMAYLGDASEYTPEQLQACKACVEAWAKQYEPLTAMVSGVGRFAGEPDNKDVIYASVDSYRLPGMRESLWAELGKVGVKARTDHGFTPHVTLKYVASNDPYMPAPMRMAVKFDKVVFICGGTMHECAMKAEEDLTYSRVLTKAGKERYTLGVVYEPGSPTETDTQGDFATAETIEKACWDFMRKLQGVAKMDKAAVDLLQRVLKALETGEPVEVNGDPGELRKVQTAINDMHLPTDWEQPPDIVECYIQRTDTTINGQPVKAGSWLMGVVWPPDYFARIERGERTGFSMEGRGRKVRVDA